MVTETIVTVAVVAGLVEVLKRALNIPSNILPLLSVVIGVLLGAAYTFVGDQVLLDGVFAGLIAGLTASGAYDVVTKTAK